jgi:mitogen-activated protein kinase kinase kinase 3
VNEGGGVLASLSRNVPAVRRGKPGNSSQRGEEETIIHGENIDTSLVSTPPPMKVVVLEKSKADFSPLTQPRLPKQGKKKSVTTSLDNDASSFEDSEDEEDGTTSTNSFSPIINKTTKSHTTAKRRYIVESSDEETAEMDDAEEDNDPNETLLPDDSDAENQSEDLDTEAEESTNAYESELEDVDEECTEAFEEDDDEYVPDDEECASSDEELSDYVEDEKKELKKQGARRNKSSTSTQPQRHHVKATNEDDMVDSVREGVETEKPHEPTQTEDVGDQALHNLDEDANFTIKENTTDEPYGRRQTSEQEMPNIEALNLEASEGGNVSTMDDDEHGDILIATVVEDDDDDFYDDDVLVATIVDDDAVIMDEKAADGKDICIVGDQSEAEEDEFYLSDESSSTSEAENEQIIGNSPSSVEPNFSDGHSERETDSNNKENAAVINSPAKEVELTTVSGMNDPPKGEREETDTGVAYKTPLPNPRKDRKSFFRVDGIVKFGKWKLGSKIGVGSFGTVHVGMNNETGKLMAVKIFKIDEAIMKDVRREVELMRSLDHQNIVRYLGAQMDKVHIHIFQEWVPGGSVATLLGRFGPFSLPVIQSYLSQTLSGLAYLHENDIIHRDIKGSNILVNDEGIVKLADFGASKKLNNLRANLMMSMTIRGTPYFMSPEVFEEKYSAKADIWGIGCVAYQMMTGIPPWKEGGFSNPISLFNHIKKHNGPPIVDKENTERLMKEDKNIFHFLDDLLHLCFEKDPSKRPDAVVLLEHTFFTKMHHDVDDEATPSRGLFSPDSASKTPKLDSTTKFEFSRLAESTSPSPMRPPAPTPSTITRSKSVVKWRTTFSSPPGSSRRSHTTKVASPAALSPLMSPPPDTSAWPDWAQAELEKRNLFAKTPVKGLASDGDETKLCSMMDSLALSTDTNAVDERALGRASQSRVSTIGTTADQSRLVGLNLLENSNATFEI